MERTTWTIWVCDHCGRVHTSGRGVVCRDWAEHESHGKLEQIEVVRATSHQGAMKERDELRNMLIRVLDAVALLDRSEGGDAA